MGQAWQRGYDTFERLYPFAEVELRTAIALDPNDLEANRVLCEAYMDQKRLDDAWRHHERAYALNPNDPRIVAQRGEMLTWLGKPDQGADWVRSSMRLDPYETHTRAHLLGRALFAQELYREAAAAFAANPKPLWRSRAEHAAALALNAEVDAAKSQSAEVMRQNPGFSAGAYGARLPFTRDRDRVRLTEGMVAAGLPR
jgi:adenylate cyclase